MQSLRFVPFLLLALVGCGPSVPDADFVLAENAIIGGPERTEIVAHDEAGVARVELYLDDARVAAVGLAPFVAVWDASPFTEGRHRLVARAYASDGRVGVATRDVYVDNTPPTVGTIEDPQVGVLFDLPVLDNVGIDRVSATVDGATLVLDDPPWAWVLNRCGPTALTIEATDLAGSTTRRTLSFAAHDLDDADCDGARLSMPPYDCDDADPRVHPLAVDAGRDPIDLDCDGVPGRDVDGDGVAAIGAGGDDCDDHDPSTHGESYRWRTTAVPDADPGAAPPVMARDGAVLHLAYVDANGTLRYRATSALDYSGPSEGILAGAGIVPVAIVVQDGQPVIVTRDPGGVYVTAHSATGWSTRRLDPNPAVSDIATVVDGVGTLHLAWATSAYVFAAQVTNGVTTVEVVAIGTASDVAIALPPDGFRHVLLVRDGAITDLRGIPGASPVAVPVPSQLPVVEVASVESPPSLVVLADVAVPQARAARRYPWNGQAWEEPTTYGGTLPATAHHLLARYMDIFVEADLGGFAPVVLRAQAGLDHQHAPQPVAYAPLGAVPAGLQFSARDGLADPMGMVFPAPEGPDVTDHDCNGAAD